jgi:Ca-activated chloride channel family protein
VRGSRADRGLGMAATLLERAGFTRGEVLLVTDSAGAGDAAKARELSDHGIITSVLAIGTVDGSPIPSGSGFLTDRGGNVIITRLDIASLQAVAQAGGGKFSELETAAAGLGPWAGGEGSEFARREDALGERWQDSGPWLVLLLLPLALIGFRRGVLFRCHLVSGPLLHVPEAQAGWWSDAWQRRDQQAWQALKKEDNERAAALANDPDISGEAWYRSGQYDNALAAWAKRPTADAEDNKGNTLAHLGEYAGALQAYDRALEMEPGMEDARFNRELVDQLKQQQEQQQKDQEGDKQEGESQEGESSEQASEGDASACVYTAP